MQYQKVGLGSRISLDPKGISNTTTIVPQTLALPCFKVYHEPMSRSFSQDMYVPLLLHHPLFAGMPTDHRI